MTEWNSIIHFEDAIESSFIVPKIRDQFVCKLNDELMREAKINYKNKRRIFNLQPAWVLFLAFLLICTISVLAIGPQQVYATMEKLLSYIPGVGIIDRNSSIRVLAETVNNTQDGITVTVTSATLTNDKTYLNYSVSGVPQSAYPEEENGKGGCIEPAYLLFPDGTKLIAANTMEAIPSNVNEVILVIPCIFNTLPGTVPTDWKLTLRFIPASPDKIITPVIEILPTPSPSPETSKPLKTDNPLAITNIMDIGNQYLIIGEIRYGVLGELAHDNVYSDDSIWVIIQDKLVDGNGKELPILSTDDIVLPTPTTTDASVWYIKVNKDFTAPLVISYSAEHITPIGNAEEEKFGFDVGENPQNHDEWQINQDFYLGGYKIHLNSITYSSNFGYEFHFTSDSGASINWIKVNIEGYNPNCGGGAGGGGDGDDISTEFTERFCITKNGVDKFPTGKLTGILRFQAVIRTDQTFQLQWSPNATQLIPEITSTP